MKRLSVIFVLCFVSVFGILYCYADEPVKAVNIMEGLPLAAGYATAEENKLVELYNGDLQKLLGEQQLNLNILNSIYYMGTYQGGFEGSSLSRCLNWTAPDRKESPLFATEVYQGYLRLRTEKALQSYQTSGLLNYASFIKEAKAQFDSYIKTAVKTESAREQLLLLQQEKLTPKLLQLEDKKRKPMLEELMNLRLPANSSKSMEVLYQLFEAHVRMELFDKMVELNKQSLEKLMASVSIIITSERRGVVELQSSRPQVPPIRLPNTLTEETGYRGYAKLSQLHDRQSTLLTFVEEGKKALAVSTGAAALKAVRLDEKGLMSLNLDEWIKNAEAKPENPAVNPALKQEGDSLQKNLEQLYQSKTKASQEIIKELNRYSIYLELKNKKISNQYTKSFEEGLSQWKKSLDAKLNAFGTDGAADYVGYLKKFEQLDGLEDKAAGESKLVASFRNTDLQFKETREGMLRVLDLLYKAIYAK
jgi:PHD/YefM family antitoxin component YafN of YafNO toxin-antitoxin module